MRRAFIGKLENYQINEMKNRVESLKEFLFHNTRGTNEEKHIKELIDVNRVILKNQEDDKQTVFYKEYSDKELIQLMRMKQK